MWSGAVHPINSLQHAEPLTSISSGIAYKIALPSGVLLLRACCVRADVSALVPAAAAAGCVDCCWLRL
jgi:hypothetical protein